MKVTFYKWMAIGLGSLLLLFCMMAWVPRLFWRMVLAPTRFIINFATSPIGLLFILGMIICAILRHES